MEMNLAADTSQNVGPQNVGPDEQTKAESTELVLEHNVPIVFDSSNVKDDMISITNQYTNNCNSSDEQHKLQVEPTKASNKETFGDKVLEIMAWENQVDEGFSGAGDEDSEKVAEFQLSSLNSENGSPINSDVDLTAITHSAPGYSFVPIQIKSHSLSSEDSSSDSDSDSDSSSSSSSSSSASTAFPSVSLSALLLDGDDEEDLPGKDGKGFPVTPKDVLHLNELPAVDDIDITLPANVEMRPFGVVTSIVDQLVIFESRFNQPVLSEGSVIFKENRSSAGKIFDIFGPIPRPSYLLRFNSEEHIAAHGIKVEDIMYFVPNSQEFTNYLETEKLKQQKGSDASWTNDEEPPPDVLDYSDDEKEREARKQRKSMHEGRKKMKTEQKETDSDGKTPAGILCILYFTILRLNCIWTSRNSTNCNKEAKTTSATLYLQLLQASLTVSRSCILRGVPVFSLYQKNEGISLEVKESLPCFSRHASAVTTSGVGTLS
ncbi:H/ACA ribonucleoprotein complex non-core subunit NAF1 isoform X2 [Pleurodeles waltl]|uniref:H/ACA ribonucleoprotein complex non-core subunit NAF1 isoform X2 n=1 Tax=Pleurodeles waltl TaxID=8319 RepID=UPI0037095D60